MSGFSHPSSDSAGAGASTGGRSVSQPSSSASASTSFALNPHNPEFVPSSVLLAQAQEQQQQQAAALAAVPDPVKRYIIAFYQAIQNNSLPEITAAYEGSWSRLTDKFYAKTEWPEAEVIAPLVQEGEKSQAFSPVRLGFDHTFCNLTDQQFLTLYRELWFR